MKTRQRARYIVQTTATLVAVAAWVAGGFPQSATAQQAGASGGGLEEVIVTAQRREQNGQEIGISLSAVTGADLTNLGVVNATDITKSMPAVVLTQPNGPSSFSLAIRGVVQNDFADHQESPAAIYVDGRLCESDDRAGILGVRHRPRRGAAADRREACSAAMRPAGLRTSSHAGRPTRRAGIWT